MRERLQRINVRSNTAPVKPQQLHYPPEGGRGGRREEGGERREERGGRTDKEAVCVRISVMKTDCRSGIQSSAELNALWGTEIVQVMCSNKI